MKITSVINPEKQIIKLFPTTSIIDALTIMNNKNVRRLTVVDAGTNRVVGVLTNTDIVNLFGGGSKYNLVKSKHNGNFYAMINEPIKEIMTEDPISVKETALTKELVSLFVERYGGLPIVTKEDILITLVTERDLLSKLKDKLDKNLKIKDCMTKNPVLASLGQTLGDVAKVMLRNGFRRLPVASEGNLKGIITSTDFIKLIGSDWAFEKLKTGNIEEITDTRISELMNKDVKTLNPENSIIEAVDLILNNNFGAIPIVDPENPEKIVGIITEKDILSCFCK
ncbi:CBS domain-containing protein [Methanococcus voltae]|uniref:CBS domain-containing protein n=2 Tax=Methanococcus voltae TaxID=2188 RepID=A0A8J7RJF2_METVO|nr:CBS domain-containing protein [Methanococcus voltae]MBP2172958.1 CBS domain-containing protein [Methanococcus voltae]MBP2201986.1 CBS domain-containing protein [Methanococcus voltae]MCS3922149.1 CBS domain-containing protein [Methanococcus voltae PS]